MSDLKELQQRVISFRDERDWEKFHNPKDSAVSLLLETAEFLEHFQWKSPDEVKSHLAKSHPDVSGELCDVFYWVLLIAHDLKINISEEFERKMKKNEAKYPIEKAKGSNKKYTDL